MQQSTILSGRSPFCGSQLPNRLPSVPASTVANRSTQQRTATRMALTVTRWNDQQDGKLTTDTLLRRLKGLGFSGTIYKFGPGTTFGWHTHGQDKKDSILTGKFRFKNREQEVVLSPGDMLDVPKGMEHYAETVGDEVVTFVDATRH